MPVVVNSRFNPFTYDELVKPVQNMAQAHTAMEEQYNVLADNADQIAASLDPHRDPDASKRYAEYMQGLNDAASALMKGGVNSNAYQNVSNLRRSYMKDIAPIKPAIEARNEDIKNYVDAHMKNPNLLSEYDPRISSVDSYMYGAVPNGLNVDGNDIINGAAKMAQAESTRRVLHSESGKAFSDTYWRIYDAYGYNSKEMQDFLDEAKDVPQFKEIIDTVMETTGANGLTGQNLERARKMAMQGLMSGVVFKQDYDYKQIIDKKPTDNNGGGVPTVTGWRNVNFPVGQQHSYLSQKQQQDLDDTRASNSTLIVDPTSGKLQTQDMALSADAVKKLATQTTKDGRKTLKEYSENLSDAISKIDVAKVAKDHHVSESFVQNGLNNFIAGKYLSGAQATPYLVDMIKQYMPDFNKKDTELLSSAGKEVEKYNKSAAALKSKVEGVGGNIYDTDVPAETQRDVLSWYYGVKSNGSSEPSIPGYIALTNTSKQASQSEAEFNTATEYSLAEKKSGPYISAALSNLSSGTAAAYDNNGNIVKGKDQKNLDLKESDFSKILNVRFVHPENTDHRGLEVRFGVTIPGSNLFVNTNETNLKKLENNVNNYATSLLDWDSSEFQNWANEAKKYAGKTIEQNGATIPVMVEKRFDLGLSEPATIGMYYDDNGILHKYLIAPEPYSARPIQGDFTLEDVSMADSYQAIVDHISGYATKVILPMYITKN